MIGMTVNGPTAGAWRSPASLAELRSATPNAPASRERLRIGTVATTLLLVVAVITMATARYY